MKRLRDLLTTGFMVYGFAVQSPADLTVLGTGTIKAPGAGDGGAYQLINDSAQNVTWLDYSVPADTWQDTVT